MSIRVDDTVTYVGGIHVGNRGLGLTGAEIIANASTGTHGQAPLINDIISPSQDNDEFRAVISTDLTNGGVLDMSEDSSLTCTVVPNTFTYNLERNGVQTGTGLLVTLLAVATPGSDITTTGWVATPGPTFYSAIDEADTPSTSDYITSPDSATPGSITLGWAQSVPVGTWEAHINLKQETLSGSQVRIVFLDASNVVVGTSSWITATGTYTTHNVTVTTTGISTKFRLEVQ